MHNLFTPVQVIKSTSNSYPPEALLRFQQQLYAITQPRVLSLADERKKLLSWFRGLPFLERRHVATFRSPEFTCMLGRLYEQWQINPEPVKYQFSYRNGRYYAKSFSSYGDYRLKEKELLDQVVLVSKSQLYEAITLSQGLLKEPQWLFDLLEELQGGVSQSLAEFPPQCLETGQISFEIQSQSEPKLLGVWVGTLIMKQIALHFVQGSKNLQPICQHHRNQEKQYFHLWQEINNEQKQKLLKSAFQMSERDIISNYGQSVEVVPECIPVIYLEGDKSNSIDFWTKCPPKELMNQLTYSSLRQSFCLGSMYRMQIIIQIQSLLSQSKKAAKNKKSKARKKKKREESVIEHKTLSIDIGTLASKASINNQKSKLTARSQSEIKPLELQEGQQPPSAHQEEKKSSEVMMYQQKVKIEENEMKIKKSQIKEQVVIIENQKSSKQEKNINNQLQNIYKKIKEDTRDRARKIILNRLLHILGRVGLSCKAYGSYASQLSLPDSDLDVSVDSSVLSFFSFEYLPYRNQIILALQFIANTFKEFPWISNFVLLDKAKVPLLSFTADASYYFQLKPQQKSKFRINSKKIDPNKSLIQVDLTIQPFANTPELPHYGLQSTQSLKAWMNTYPFLEKTIILLKILLRKTGLHKSFEGGVSSYTLSLLLIAFFRHHQEPLNSIEEALSNFSSFIKTVIQQKWLIDPQGQTPILKQSPTNHSFLKHPYDGHNLLEKCLRLSQALEVISDWPSLCRYQL